jgi:hypothetical protein
MPFCSHCRSKMPRGSDSMNARWRQRAHRLRTRTGLGIAPSTRQLTRRRQDSRGCRQGLRGRFAPGHLPSPAEEGGQNHEGGGTTRFPQLRWSTWDDYGRPKQHSPGWRGRRRWPPLQSPQARPPAHFSRRQRADAQGFVFGPGSPSGLRCDAHARAGKSRNSESFFGGNVALPGGPRGVRSRKPKGH